VLKNKVNRKCPGQAQKLRKWFHRCNAKEENALDRRPARQKGHCENDRKGAGGLSFPRDTTNQWFNEARFEGYRALGKTSAAAASEEIAAAIRRILG
jgi:hypothetical protein